jgi:hypothetical protein
LEKNEEGICENVADSPNKIWPIGKESLYMTITAKIIADSVSPQQVRLTTIQLRYPRFIHAEFMTHRVFSRNASSSRAIPVDRLIKDVMEDPAMPIYWGKNQKGMQAEQECDTPVQYGIIPRSNHIGAWNEAAYITNEEAWLKARDNAVGMARAFTQAGYHKQIVNRLLEPFCHINVVVTATEWSNFFALRDHEGAQPEIRELAQWMKEAMKRSTPHRLEPGDWHVPYLTEEEGDPRKSPIAPLTKNANEAISLGIKVPDAGREEADHRRRPRSLRPPRQLSPVARVSLRAPSNS